MANTNRPNGFTPVGTMSGSPWQASVTQYSLDATHAALAVGDLVQMTADGYLDILAAGETQMMGVVVGVLNQASVDVLGKQGDHFLSSSSPTLSGVNAHSVPLNTAGVILVCTAPDVILEAQEDGDTDPLELADIGSNVEIIGGGPDSTTGISDMMIDSSSHATTNTLPLRLLGLAQRPDNEYISGGQAYTRWLVTPANHALSGLNVGI
jgi:hypothetical protein